MLQCFTEECVPIPTTRKDYFDMRERLYAAAKTGELMLENGYKINDVGTAKKKAARILNDIAVSDRVDEYPLVPETAVVVGALLKRFDERIVSSATQLRLYITNRLVLESDNPDPKIRMRALELLGKISDVGLFTERSEVTINNRTTTELESTLKQKLKRIMDAHDVSDVPDKGHITINDVSVASELEQPQ